ncbi:hypothetical protein [Clostridium perfringens]|uniref:hypothetical protein n=1 Tax=Clostridium perfringens TaxID=1502 RepID=UPI0039EB3EAA
MVFATTLIIYLSLLPIHIKNLVNICSIKRKKADDWFFLILTIVCIILTLILPMILF